MIQSEVESRFKTVLITGINGSGGYYLAKHILENNKSVNVHGTMPGHAQVIVFKKMISTEEYILLNVI